LQILSDAPPGGRQNLHDSINSSLRILSDAPPGGRQNWQTLQLSNPKILSDAPPGGRQNDGSHREVYDFILKRNDQ
jgi:hypothetical protein